MAESKTNGSHHFEVLAIRQDTLQEKVERLETSVDKLNTLLSDVKSTVDKHSVYFENICESVSKIEASQDKMLTLIQTQQTSHTELSTKFNYVKGILVAIGTALLGLALKLFFPSAK